MSLEINQQIAEVLFKIPQILNTPWEKNFDPTASIKFANDNWTLCFGLIAAYLLVITVGKSVMDKYPAFNLRLPLAAWNAFLCTFSFIGMLRTVPYLFGMIMSRSFEDTISPNPLNTWGYGPTGFWVMLFIYSKVPELIDTVFIVLRKKPLIFLHWYHHVTVLLYCWSAYSTIAGSGLYFVAMNYTVHALMYGYYCLQALGVCPKSFPTVLITMAQIAQMFIGTGICMSAWWFKFSGRPCHNELSNLVGGGIMYGSYLYLFCEFAVKRYIFGSSKKSKAGAKKLE